MTQSTASVRLVVILGAISAFAPLSIDMYLPGFAAIGREFGAPAESVQLTLSAFFVGLAAGQFIYGPLSDHFGRKPPLTFGLLLYILASVGCGLAPNIETLIVMRTLQALGGCSGVIIASAMVRDLFPPQVGARMYSRLFLVIGVAPIIAPTVGAWIVQVASWRTIFWILTGIGAACLLATTLLLPETHRPEGKGALALRPVIRDYAMLLKDRRYLGYAFAVALAHASVLAYVTAAPFVLIQVYGVTTTEFGLLFAVNAFALVATAQWNAHLLHAHPAETLLARANLVPPVLGALLLAVTAAEIGGLTALMMLLFLFLCTMSIVRPNATACALAHHPERAGTANSLIGALQFLLATVAGAFMSLIHDGTGKPMALTMLLFSIAGLVLHRRLTHAVPATEAS